MPWLVLAALAAILIFTQRRVLRVPNARSASIAALTVLAMLAARGGRFSVALGLGLFAAGLVMFWRLDDQKRRRAEPPPPPWPGSRMSPQEAYAVLGLPPGATPEEIKQAHRRLMKLAHPDAGGTTRRAARLNAAKDLLLGRR